MNEQELLDSLHDSKILAIKKTCPEPSRRDGGQVIIELDFVDHWEPQQEEGHYRLVYVPARLIFEDAEIVAQTGDYTHLDDLPDFHHARTILWVDVVDGVYHFATTGDGSLAIRAERVRLERQERGSPVNTCELCRQGTGEMEFNMPTPLGLLRALICLDCWARCPDDQAVAQAIIRARKPLAVAEFNLDPEVFSHVEDIPSEIKTDVMFFILNGRRCTGE